MKTELKKQICIRLYSTTIEELNLLQLQYKENKNQIIEKAIHEYYAKRLKTK